MMSKSYKQLFHKLRTRTAITTLRFKMAASIAALLLITATVFSVLTIQTMNRHILNEVIKRTESLAKSTAAVASYSILAGDVLGTDNIVSKVKEANIDVEYVVIMDTEMKILAHSDVARRGEAFTPYPRDILKENADGTRVYEVRRAGDDPLEFVAPVMFNNTPIGTVIVGINNSVLSHARAETRRKILAGLGITILLGIGCVIVLSSLVTRPIRELARGVDELKQGHQTKLRIYSHDELGSLTASFNRMTELITRQQARLGTYATELEEAYVSTVKVLSAAIDARDPYTLGHSTRVARFATAIGAAMGLPPQELEDIEIASLFHDVGKLKTPDEVLLKDGPLDPQEHREIASHSENGAAILGRAASLQKYMPAVRHHHEWFNGEGYPDRLRGEDIPLHAAIISVADAFDAMTSARPYKDALSREEALRELTLFAGRQFHPQVVEVFHQVIEAHSESAELSTSKG
ncbi:MAG TPA: HD domain-containing phosphohydrolase [Nitrospirota bacterium]